MDVFLFGANLTTWPLELDEERSAARDEEHSIGPTGLAGDVELEVANPELQRLTADLLLDR